jgi:hypothetical protein
MWQCHTSKHDLVMTHSDYRIAILDLHTSMIEFTGILKL